MLKTLKEERLDYSYAVSGHCVGTMPVPEFLETFLEVKEILRTPATAIEFGATLTTNPGATLTERELSLIWVREQQAYVHRNLSNNFLRSAKPLPNVAFLLC